MSGRARVSRGRTAKPAGRDRAGGSTAERPSGFYWRCASLIDDLDAKSGSLRSLASKHEARGDARRLLALCIEALKARSFIDELVVKTRLLRREAKAFSTRDPSAANLALVLLHDALFSKRGVEMPKDSALQQAIERSMPIIRAEQAKLMAKRGVTTDADLKSPLNANGKRVRPSDDVDEAAPGRVRWLRVNTAVWSVEAAKSWLKSHGYNESLEIDERSYAVDEHLPILLSFHASTQLESLAPYRDGRLIAQDKASCFPPWILANGHIARAIDATAAPGNKTTMLAALMQDGSVTAFERDAQRFETLKSMLKRARVDMHGDFLAVDPQDPAYSDVTHILVDPSCCASHNANRLTHTAGSGIVSRLDGLSADASIDAQRIKSLSAFQVTILSHAMRFSSAQRIVYSTCSLHESENELVVARVLRKPEFADWRVAPRSQVLPTWPRRGLVGHPFSDDVIRCDPDQDSCNGFFVACLIKSAPLESPLEAFLGVERAPRKPRRSRPPPNILLPRIKPGRWTIRMLE